MPILSGLHRRPSLEGTPKGDACEVGFPQGLCRARQQVKPFVRATVRLRHRMGTSVKNAGTGESAVARANPGSSAGTSTVARATVGSGQALICCFSSLVVIGMRRGLAWAATGMDKVSTPCS